MQVARLLLVNEDDEPVAVINIAGEDFDIETEYGLADITSDDDPDGSTRLMITKLEE
jgi:hypothetical protein